MLELLGDNFCSITLMIYNLIKLLIFYFSFFKQ